ncbi:hypothetical protein HNP72_001081 [Sphingobacterium soli]|nr:hypothetical protein [Sphingobacterium soli]
MIEENGVFQIPHYLYIKEDYDRKINRVWF